MGTVAVLKMIDKDQTEVVDYLKRFEVDVNPRRLGIDEETFVYCMKHATEMRNNRYTYLHEIELRDEKIKQVYREMVKEL